MTHATVARRLSRHPLWLAALLLPGACAAPTPTASQRHVAPTSGPSAKLVMRGQVAEGEMYGVFVHDDAVACRGPRIVGAGNATRVPPSSAVVAGRLTTVDFRAFKADKRSCYVRMSFTPEAGRSYLVSGTMAGSVCNVRLLDATDPDVIKPVTGALRRNTATQACVALADARPFGAPTAGGQRDGDAVLMPGASTTDLDGLLKP